MILLLDNYDSFTYNVYQMVGRHTADIQVIRNDRLSLDDICRMQPERLILSPGPGYPEQSGVMIDLIRALRYKIPILGICLGHQALGYAFGARIVEAPEPVHGKRSEISLDLTCPLFTALPERLGVGRYHSLVVASEDLPACLQVTARSDDGLIMALRHRTYPLFGLQFHPESILTEGGDAIVQRFLAL